MDTPHESDTPASELRQYDIAVAFLDDLAAGSDRGERSHIISDALFPAKEPEHPMAARKHYIGPDNPMKAFISVLGDPVLTERIEDSAFQKGVYDIAAVAAHKAGKPDRIARAFAAWGKHIHERVSHSPAQEDTITSSNKAHDARRYGELLATFGIHSKGYRTSEAFPTEVNRAYAIGLALDWNICSTMYDFGVPLDAQNKALVQCNVERLRKLIAESPADRDKEKEQFYRTAGKLARLQTEEGERRRLFKDFVQFALEQERVDTYVYVGSVVKGYESPAYTYVSPQVKEDILQSSRQRVIASQQRIEEPRPAEAPSRMLES